ncbi:MAG: hypothetical protein ACYSUI_19655 [Planctomycetota bacterium]
MKEFLRLLFAPCSDISRHATISMDHELPRAHRVVVGFHIWYCNSCRRYRRQIRFIREAFLAFMDGAAPADAHADVSLPPDARERIRHAIRER